MSSDDAWLTLPKRLCATSAEKHPKCCPFLSCGEKSICPDQVKHIPSSNCRKEANIVVPLHGSEWWYSASRQAVWAMQSLPSEDCPIYLICNQSVFCRLSGKQQRQRNPERTQIMESSQRPLFCRCDYWMAAWTVVTSKVNMPRMPTPMPLSWPRCPGLPCKCMSFPYLHLHRVGLMFSGLCMARASAWLTNLHLKVHIADVTCIDS